MRGTATVLQCSIKMKPTLHCIYGHEQLVAVDLRDVRGAKMKCGVSIIWTHQPIISLLINRKIAYLISNMKGSQYQHESRIPDSLPATL